MTVIGAGFHPGEKVYCNLGNSLGFVPGTVQDANTILCTVPNSGDGMGDIDEANTVITDEFGNSLLSPADPDDKDEDFLKKLPSQIDTVGPTSGAAFGGTFVIVQGINFTPQTLCKFGYYPETTAIFVSSTQIMCESPPHTSGLGLTVEVSNNLGMDWSGAGYLFAYESTAQLDYVAPRQGSVIGGSGQSRISRPGGCRRRQHRARSRHTAKVRCLLASTPTQPTTICTMSRLRTRLHQTSHPFIRQLAW